VRNVLKIQKNALIASESSWFKYILHCLQKRKRGFTKQFQILGTDPVERVDEYCTRVERSYFGHCSNKTAGCVETGGGGVGYQRGKK